MFLEWVFSIFIASVSIDLHCFRQWGLVPLSDICGRQDNMSLFGNLLLTLEIFPDYLPQGQLGSLTARLLRNAGT